MEDPKLMNSRPPPCLPCGAREEEEEGEGRGERLRATVGGGGGKRSNGSGAGPGRAGATEGGLHRRSRQDAGRRGDGKEGRAPDRRYRPPRRAAGSPTSRLARPKDTSGARDCSDDATRASSVDLRARRRKMRDRSGTLHVAGTRARCVPRRCLARGSRGKYCTPSRMGTRLRECRWGTGGPKGNRNLREIERCD